MKLHDNFVAEDHQCSRRLRLLRGCFRLPSSFEDDSDFERRGWKKLLQDNVYPLKVISVPLKSGTNDTQVEVYYCILLIQMLKHIR